jgi:hypothetical protein
MIIIEMNSKYLLDDLKGRDHVEDLSIDRKIILEWILGKRDGTVWSGCIWLRIGTIARLRVPCKTGNLLNSCVTISFSKRTLLHGVNKSVSQYVYN